MSKVLKNVIETAKIEYPKDKELWAVIYTDVPMGVAAKFTTNDPSNVFGMIAAVVKEWNFADEDGTELPITEDGCKKLPSAIATWIVQTITGLVSPGSLEDKKKQ